MPLALRAYQGDNKYWHWRAFVREIFLRNDRREIRWHVARLDYWRWHGVENAAHCRLEEVVFLWEAAAGHPSGPPAARLGTGREERGVAPPTEFGGRLGVRGCILPGG